MPELKRGEREPAPKENNDGWRLRVNFFTGRGTYVVNIVVWNFPQKEGESKRPAEIYLSTSLLGSTTDSFLKALGKEWSRELQLGAHVNWLADRLKDETGVLQGGTNYAAIPNVLSIQDFMGRLLIERYPSPQVSDSGK